MARPTSRQRTQREIVRALFRHRPFLLLMLTLGTAVGFLPTWTAEPAYRGQFELTSGPPQDGLPTVAELRHRLLAPENLARLLPASQREAVRLERAGVDPNIEAIRAGIEMERLTAGDVGERAIWQVSVEVPSAWTPEAAHERLSAYADAVSVAADSSPAPVETRVADEPRPTLSAVRAAEETEDLADQLAELEREADRLGVVLGSLPESLQEAREDVADAERRLRSLRDAQQLEAETLAWLDSGDEELPLPPAVGEQYPRLRALQEAVADLERRSRADTESDSAADLERRLDDTIDEYATMVAQVARQYRLQVERTAEQLQETESSIGPARKRVEALAELARQQASYDRAVADTARDAEVPAPAPLPGPLARRQAAAPAPVLVAGPFVEPERIRPRTLRDVLIAGSIGLALGVGLVLLRLGADQRIHVPSDMEKFELELEVFGAIPESKRHAPVCFERG